MKGLTRLAVLLCVLSSCSGDRYYTRVQTVDGLEMTAPITFTVRIKLDTARQRMQWMQEAIDARGHTARSIDDYGDTQLTPCQIFDEENWTCRANDINGKSLIAIDMTHGVLTRMYWSQQQTYTKHSAFRGLHL